MTGMSDIKQRTGRLCRRIAAAVLALGLTVTAVAAQTPDALETRRAQSSDELERINAALTLSQERSVEIAEEIAGIRRDHESLSAALVRVAEAERRLGEEATAIAGQLDLLRLREGDLRASLHERRGVLAEVLGALQRMGLNPPPAILVRPEDALSSVRSAILLAAVVPELREETQVLIGDLQELSRIMASIESRQERLLGTLTEQAEEQARLSLLLQEKQLLQ